jgi:hypothetical protein
MKIRPRVRTTLRALDGRRIIIEGFGRRAPAFVAVTGGGGAPSAAWLSPTALRHLATAIRKIRK